MPLLFGRNDILCYNLYMSTPARSGPEIPGLNPGMYPPERLAGAYPVYYPDDPPASLALPTRPDGFGLFSGVRVVLSPPRPDKESRPGSLAVVFRSPNEQMSTANAADPADEHSLAPVLLGHETDQSWYRPLDDSDKTWLERLLAADAQEGSRTPAVDIAAYNALIQQGSPNLEWEKRAGSGGTFAAGVIEARRQFFGLLGFDSQKHPLNKTYMKFAAESPALLPLDTFVAAQRAYETLGMRGDLLVKRNKTCVWLSPGRIFELCQALKAHGIDYKAALERNSALFNYHPDSITEKLTALEEYGINTPKMLKRCPTVMSISVETTRTKIDLLHARGLSASRVANTFPNVLTLSADNIHATIQAIETAGCDPVTIIHGFPSVLGLSVGTIAKRVSFISAQLKAIGSGRTAQDILTYCPTYFGHSEKKLTALIEIYKALGDNDTNPLPDTLITFSCASRAPVAGVLTESVENGVFTIPSTTHMRTDGSQRQALKLAREQKAKAILQDPKSLQKLGAAAARACALYLYQPDSEELASQLALIDKHLGPEAA